MNTHCPSCGSKLDTKLIEGRERKICLGCGNILWENPKVTTSIVLSNDRHEILMLKRSSEPFKDYWVLPGGYVEYDEDPETAIIRETKEETGFDISPVELIDAYLINTDPRGNAVDVVYHAAINDSALELTEHSKGNYFPTGALPDKIAYKHREVIEKWSKSNELPRSKLTGYLLGL